MQFSSTMTWTKQTRMSTKEGLITRRGGPKESIPNRFSNPTKTLSRSSRRKTRSITTVPDPRLPKMLWKKLTVSKSMNLTTATPDLR